jgi:hypothetical protein
MTNRQPAGARLLFVAALFPAVVGACRTTASPEIKASDSSRAECPVCKTEGDLACVCVRVRGDTPSSSYCGCRYYFCSEECKKNFERTPGKYLKR